MLSVFRTADQKTAVGIITIKTFRWWKSLYWLSRQALTVLKQYWVILCGHGIPCGEPCFFERLLPAPMLILVIMNSDYTERRTLVMSFLLCFIFIFILFLGFLAVSSLFSVHPVLTALVLTTVLTIIVIISGQFWYIIAFLLFVTYKKRNRWN